MGLTIKTIIKIYLLFFVFQLGCNIFIETMPNIISISDTNQVFLDYLNTKVNGEFDTTTTGNSLLSNFKSSIDTTNLFNDGILNAFLGVLKVIGSVIWFVVQLALSLLFTAGLMVELLLYNFIFSVTYLFYISLAVNVGFYSMLFYIVFKRRISQ